MGFPHRRTRATRRLLHMLAFAGRIPPTAAATSAQSIEDWLSVSRVGEFAWSVDGAHIFYTSNDDESGTHILERMGAFLTRHPRLREEGAR
ncbi:MAG: hypothetical protein F4Y74_04205 [Gemmatimonadales bacterium]|nr:hypothetical protein [Gemmatimonadales bacterium]MYG18574.1 hypothetical protein [Gemmatimonadales bacterium]